MKKKKAVTITNSGTPPWRVHLLTRLVLFFLLFAGSVAVIAYDRQQHVWSEKIRIGEPSSRDIYAPFDFTVVDEEETKKVRGKAGEQVSDLYILDEKVEQKARALIDKLFEELKELRQIKGTEVPGPEILSVSLSDRSFRFLSSEVSDESLKAVKQGAGEIVHDVQGRGLMPFSTKMILVAKKQPIAIKKQDKEETVSPLEITSSQEIRESVDKIAQEKFPKDRKAKNAVVEIALSTIQPNLVFDADETNRRRKAAWEGTVPILDRFLRGELVIDKGKIFTEKDRARLVEIEKKFIGKKVLNNAIGISVFVLLAVFMLASYLYFFERRSFASRRDILMIATAILFSLGVEKVILLFTDRVYFLPTSLAALLLGILIRPRVGLIVAFLMTVYTGLISSMDPALLLSALAGSVAGLYASIGLRRRFQFLRVGLVVGLVNLGVLFSVKVVSGFSLAESFQLALDGWWGGLLVAPLLFIVLPLFEHVFNVTTDVGLFELSDRNHPLLKRMVLEAPGTYHHSMMVAHLAEAACEAIGADGLLARVGAYFHDIGKIEKSEYFNENQTDKERNVHDRLVPEVSYRMISAHVQDGLELAKRYKLKGCIADFIPQHHGTDLVYYFYRKAADASERSGEVRSSDYRYGGPKPQSRETAVVLLADSVEAASRSLKEVTPENVAEVVVKITNHKFLDGQLDECDLTVKDLRKIQESFTRTLVGILHSRIKYPDLQVPDWHSETQRGRPHQPPA